MQNTQPVVNEELTDPIVGTSEEINFEEDTQETEDFGIEEPETPVQPLAGDKTPANSLLAALREERERVRRLEEQLQLNSSTGSQEVYSDEGKALEAQIARTNAELVALREEQAKKDLIAQYPVLKDKWDDLELFRLQPDNTGMSLQAAAKVFLAENGMFAPRRKGVEKSTGGPRVPVSSGMMSAQEVADLRTNNAKKYREMLKNGQIKIAPSS